MSTRPHTDDPRFICSCDDCSRTAVAAWRGYMDRVLNDELTLDEANRLADTDPTITPIP